MPSATSKWTVTVADPIGLVHVSDDKPMPNGKGKIIAGVIGAVVLALLGWIFSSVQILQISEGKMEDRIASVRADFEVQRISENNFQTEVRASLQVSQSEMRNAIQRITDILTDVRVRLGPGQDTKHK